MALLVVVALVSSCSGLIEGDMRHMVPLSDAAHSRLKAMGSSPAEAMIVRIFKEESTLEVWKHTRDDDYELFKSYDICAWSGELGPKIREGDRQAPEGFYSITPGLMNPRSNYYLAFNTGFPNKFDRVWGRTGADLMVHGDCSSRGCYAMTDAQIAEIYALGRESFTGGQRKFELQIFPFRMTNENMLKHRKSEHIAFWRNIKEGYDAFELSRKEVDWDVCEKRYTFFPAGGATDAAGACPAETTRPDLMAMVAAKQAADLSEFETASAELDGKEAEKLKREEEARIAAAESAKRSAEFNAAVTETTGGISEAVTGFFGNLFGAGSGGSGAPPSGEIVTNAPRPAPVLPRG
ncbi:MAG: murein L,D-transpeptidase [Alphaproteobacteria bacterium]|nr:murein L,D-transpeptidase [Alphaproteobacteria bacterium]